MPPPPPNDLPPVEEIDEDIYLIECLMARVAALAAGTPLPEQFRQAGRTGESLNFGSDVLVSLHEIRQLLREERARREARAKAGAEIVRLVVPRPGSVG